MKTEDKKTARFALDIIRATWSPVMQALGYMHVEPEIAEAIAEVDEALSSLYKLLRRA